MPEPQDPAGEERLHGGETILLAEDEPLIRDLLETYLSRLGYRVLSASTGAETLEVAAAHDGKIDLFVADYVLPDRSGVDVARALEASRPGLLVLYTSGHIEAEQAKDVESVHFLKKPFTPRELTERVRAILDA